MNNTFEGKQTQILLTNEPAVHMALIINTIQDGSGSEMETTTSGLQGVTLRKFI